MIIRRDLALLLILTTLNSVCASATPANPEFEVSFPASVHQQPITGRLLLMISRTNEPEVRLQVGWVTSPPVFGVDVSRFRPGQFEVIGAEVPGFPIRSLHDVPSGDYYVQALLSVYTEFHRADGHVIWAHMDQWEGQQFNLSPGNLFSKVRRIHLEASANHKIKIQLTEEIPPVETPPDTEWVKHIKIQSELLTRFWGRPMYLGAVVLLPRDYQSKPDAQYPVIYQQGHFSQHPAFDFRTDDSPENAEDRRWREANGIESGYQFFQAWSSDSFPRVIAVTFLHPTPYYDDSYAVDSANNGPYGTAILTELIPYIEKSFRIIARPYARILTGGSTGGWESLALQLFHPEFFGGTWTLYPDPIDFRRYQLVNIYKDDNAFVVDDKDAPEWTRQGWAPAPERSFARTDDGQPIATVRQVNQLEAVLGSRGRSGGQLAIWDATFGPVGNDGYPKPLWDGQTGQIDHSVAEYMRDHGYDLRYYAEANWSRIGPQINGKMNLYCGDMDNFYLNLGVYLFEQFLEKADNRYTLGSLEYGRPMKGHGWQPMTNAELVRAMSERIARNGPEGASLAWAGH
jgi:Putative esterase